MLTLYFHGRTYVVGLEYPGKENLLKFHMCRGFYFSEKENENYIVFKRQFLLDLRN